jgi:hypothetical protein
MMSTQGVETRVPTFAIVRVSSFDPAQLARSAASLQEFQKLHAGQPGYAGAITIDIAPGRHLVVNLWESEEDANSARENLLSPIDTLLGAAMNGTTLIGAGPVIDIDLPVATATTHIYEVQP